MRAPLLVLICAYAVSIGGLVLMPGMDDQGQPWRFDFFHAVYFVSFMGSTIGFGEIPYEFTAAQRAWTTVALYICVVSWLYAIGKILSLVQDPAFQRVVAEQHFAYKVRRLSTPFYLICGYGETGSLLLAALSRRNIQSVVLDYNADRINQLTLDSRSFDVPALFCDAREVKHLQEAGIEHRDCKGVIALGNDDQGNIKVAIAAKLLHPKLAVIARAQTQDAAANLASFNTDHIINPFQVFADHLAMALRSPSIHMLYEWLISAPDLPLPQGIRPPRGIWVVCGFGRFGREVNKYLEYEGIRTVIIEPDPAQAPEGAVLGRGTEAVTLREAGIDKAVGLVAGADQDINNLSIIMTAKELNPNLYIVARQNRRANDAVFKAAGLDLIMESSRILVWRILPLLTIPLLSRFLLLARHRNEEWAHALLQRLAPVCQEKTPMIWSITLSAEQAPAVHAALQNKHLIPLQNILHDPQKHDEMLPCVPLLLQRNNKEILLPKFAEPLQPDDEILLCAPRYVAPQLEWTLYNPNTLDYVLTGAVRPDGYIWRWWAQRRKHKAEAET